jgi:hypothetical protein
MIEQLKQFDLVYLASPYGKYPKGRERAFTKICRIAGKLIEAGVNVYSPIAHLHPIATYGHIERGNDFWLKFDEAIMSKSSAIAVAMMDSWETSTGIEYELNFFNKAEKLIFFLNPEDFGERP